MASYIFTHSAQSDLRDIAKYTSKQWGKDQAHRYASDLDQCFEQIVRGRIIEKQVSPDLSDVFYQRMQKHIIFYLKSAENDVVILAVLHEKMDLIERLKNRLK